MNRIEVLICLLILSMSAIAMDVSGPQNGKWTIENSPYRVVGDIEVPRGQTLSIDPGVIVNYSGRYRILVSGTLLARGLVSDSIIFKHEIPDSFHYSLDFIQNTTTSVLEYCRVQDGIADGSSKYGDVSDYHGGGIVIEGASPHIRHCTIQGNFGTYGGGMDIFGNSSPLIESNIIRNNSSDGAGGAIACSGGDSANTNHPLIINNIITGNSAPNGGAADFYAYCKGELSNNLFYSNHATFTGGAIFLNTGSNSVKIQNCISWNNSASLGDDEISTNGFPITVENSNIEGGFPGTGNINIDPQFIDPANGDFRFQENSPMVDAGTNADAPAVDFDGNARPFDGDRNAVAVTDMGPYEYLNTAPRITSTPVENVLQEQPYTYNVDATDPDVGESLVYSLSVAPAFISIDPSSGIITGTPLYNDVGDHPVAVVVADLNGATDTQNFTLRVIKTNDAPVAVDDAGTAAEDSPVTVDVLANDSDVDAGDVLTITGATTPVHGTAVVNGGADITYTPAS
ncbi:MAG: Ig-like domain-containing protein, partial [Calditrichia bacterium]